MESQSVKIQIEVLFLKGATCMSLGFWTFLDQNCPKLKRSTFVIHEILIEH